MTLCLHVTMRPQETAYAAPCQEVHLDWLVRCSCNAVLHTPVSNQRWACCFVCRIAVLDGGLPAWLAEGYQMDETPVSHDQIEAAVNAARQPPAKPQYQAHLQVSDPRRYQQSVSVRKHTLYTLCILHAYC